MSENPRAKTIKKSALKGIITLFPWERHCLDDSSIYRYIFIQHHNSKEQKLQYRCAMAMSQRLLSQESQLVIDCVSNGTVVPRQVRLENVLVTRSYNSGPNLQARSRPLFFLRSQANYYSSKADKKSVPFTKAIEEEQNVDIPFYNQDNPLGRKTISRKGKEGSLEAVKAVGMQYLEDTAKALAMKARQSLLISEEDDMPSVNQL
eukprot:scaffold69063_cov43-Attheya_sp.AAC.1